MLLMRPQETVWNAKVPLLVVHGDSDSAVPFSAAQEYCERNPGVRFDLIAGVDHGFDDQLAAIEATTAEWFLKHAAGR